MLSKIATFLRVTVLYSLLFVFCMVLVVTALKEWSEGSQMLFAFGAPAVFVWLLERRRKMRRRLKAAADVSSGADSRSERYSAQSLSPRRTMEDVPLRAGKAGKAAIRPIETTSSSRENDGVIKANVSPSVTGDNLAILLDELRKGGVQFALAYAHMQGFKGTTLSGDNFASFQEYLKRAPAFTEAGIEFAVKYFIQEAEGGLNSSFGDYALYGDQADQNQQRRKVFEAIRGEIYNTSLLTVMRSAEFDPRAYLIERAKLAGAADQADEKVQLFRPRQDNAALIEAARIRRERLAADGVPDESEASPQSHKQVDEPAGIANTATQRHLEPLRGAPQPRQGFAANVANDIRRSVSSNVRQGWIPRGHSAIIAGRDIGGMVYVGASPQLNGNGYHDKSRPYIDPTLSVAASGTDKEGRQMSYWPGYSGIPPVCRATYLDWLASGRSDVGYNPGYMFLYFYGLERRFIVDQPGDDEKLEILAEAKRLANLYADNYSVQRYLGEFIQIAQISLRDPGANEPIFDYRGWELPFGLKVAIGTRIAQDEPLSWDWALSWLICHPEHHLRTPATRCAEEFRALFRLRFEERFPDGLKVTKPRKMLRSRYEAASSEFHADLAPEVNGKAIPDISGLRKPVEIASEIAEDVTEALDKFSRYLGRNPDGRGSIEAQALLPAELRALFPSEELERLKDWARAASAEGGLVPAVDVIFRLEGMRPEKLTKAQLTGAADTLARIGFGLAPDPRFALRSPKVDEPLVIFNADEPIEKLEDVSSAYRAALLELAMGVFVVQADGVVSEAERQALSGRIGTTAEVSESERKRLKANMEWLLAVPPDLPLLRRKLKDAGPDAKVAVREALIVAAHADGFIQAEEVAGIEKLYKALGLDPGLVYSDIHAGDIADSPVRVKAAQNRAPGEAIPVEELPAAYKLDASRIAAIRSDTERVSSVLGEIFALDQVEDDPKAAAGTEVLTGLDAAMTALVRELVKEAHLTDEEFSTLCSRHGLMAAGALEAINEWAFETYDEALLEEYDGYDIAPEIAAAIKSDYEKEGRNVQA